MIKQFEPMEKIYLLWTPGVDWRNDEILWCQDENPLGDPDTESTPYIRQDIVDGIREEMTQAIRSAMSYFEMLEQATGVEHGVLKDLRAVLEKYESTE